MEYFFNLDRFIKLDPFLFPFHKHKRFFKNKWATFESFNIIKQEESCSSNKDTFSIQIKFRNGSIAIINYLSNGSKSYQKETLEVFSSGNVYQLNNFRNLKIWSKKGYKKINSFLQNKGNNECVQSFINSIIEKKNSPIPFEEIYEVQELMLKLNQKLI